MTTPRIKFAYNLTTAGGDGSLDTYDGAVLADGFIGLVITDQLSSGVYSAYWYRLNASSGASESLPQVIAPNSNAGTKRWELVAVFTDIFRSATNTETLSDTKTLLKFYLEHFDLTDQSLQGNGYVVSRQVCRVSEIAELLERAKIIMPSQLEFTHFVAKDFCFADLRYAAPGLAERLPLVNGAVFQELTEFSLGLSLSLEHAELSAYQSHASPMFILYGTDHVVNSYPADANLGLCAIGSSLFIVQAT